MDINFFLGLFPLLALIVMILGFKMPVWKAVLVTLAIVIGVAWFGFNTPALTVSNSIFYGFVKGFWPIVVVVFGAIYSYNVMQKTQAVNVIRNVLSNVSDDERVLVLLITWGFGGFLEAAAGFSTAVAIPLGILMALGFNPIRAAVAALVADTVCTTFGAVGIPIVVLGDQLHVPTHGFMGVSALTMLQLAVMDFIIPFAIIFIMHRSYKAFKGIIGMLLAVGLTTFIPQMITAIYLGPELTAFAGSITSMAVIFFLVKIRKTPTPEQYRVKKTQATTPSKYSFMEILRACAIYILMFIFILASSPLFPSVKAALGSVATVFNFPLANGAVLHAKFDWIATPGMLIMFATVIGGILFQRASVVDLVKVFVNTTKQLWQASIAISAIVAMATLMDRSGLIRVVAEPLLLLTGDKYPYMASLIGAIGTFITGSVTNSNVLFGNLQVLASHNLHLDPVWLLAANSAGATATKMIAPQSISIAVGAAGLVNQDSTLMKGTAPWVILYIIIVSAVAGLGAHYFLT